jgi:predicted transcriptional regulator
MAGGTTLLPVRVETGFKERLVRYAEQQDRSVSWVIKKAAAEYLDRREDEEHGPTSRKRLSDED